MAEDNILQIWQMAENIYHDEDEDMLPGELPGLAQMWKMCKAESLAVSVHIDLDSCKLII